MIEMASNRRITKVSRVFPWAYKYTSRVDRVWPLSWKRQGAGSPTKGPITAMKKFNWKYVPIFVIFALSMALAPVFHAQSQGSLTRITPVPADAAYQVDGQYYNRASSALWPAGTKHTLWVSALIQTTTPRTQYIFSNWEWSGGTLPNPATVTASPDITEYRALFTTNYDLELSFGGKCADLSNCVSAGTVMVNGTPFIATGDIYLGAGSTVVLQAIPNPGYIFLGWQPGPNQTIVAFQDTVTLASPMTVYPQFELARTVNLATDPPGRVLLADRALVPTPATMEWAD